MISHNRSGRTALLFFLELVLEQQRSGIALTEDQIYQRWLDEIRQPKSNRFGYSNGSYYRTRI